MQFPFSNHRSFGHSRRQSVSRGTVVVGGLVSLGLILSTCFDMVVAYPDEAESVVPALAVYEENEPKASSVSRDALEGAVTKEAALEKPGSLGIEEYKPTLFLELKSSKSRLFRLDEGQIVRTSISDPGIVEPVVLSENQILLIGKIPGRAKLCLWDSTGRSLVLDLRVTEEGGAGLISKAGRLFEGLFGLESQAKFEPFGAANVSYKELDLNSARLNALESKKRAREDERVKALAQAKALAEKKAKEKIEDGKKEDGKKQDSTDQSADDRYKRVVKIIPPTGSRKHEIRQLIDKLSVPPNGVLITIVSGAELEKGSRILPLEVSQSRTCKIKNKILKTTVSDPGIAEGVVCSESVVVILGKAEGRASLSIEDSQGNKETLEVVVSQPKDRLSARWDRIWQNILHSFSGDKRLTDVAPFKTKAIKLMELKSTERISLSTDESRLFEFAMPVVRTSLTDPLVAELVQLSPGEVAFRGKLPDRSTTFFVWDCNGNVSGIELKSMSSEVFKKSGHDKAIGDVKVAGNKASSSKKANGKLDLDYEKSLVLAPYMVSEIGGGGDASDLFEIEQWTGSRKDVVSFSSGNVDSIPAYERPNNSYRAIELNNRGVRAIKAQNFKLAIQELREALTVDRSYELSQRNLAIAYNNNGLGMQSEPIKALGQFHLAQYLDPENQVTRQNVSSIIRFMGRDPGNFKDRMAMADIFRRDGCIIGAYMEYQAALKIKSGDEEAKQKLDIVKKALKNYKVD